LVIGRKKLIQSPSPPVARIKAGEKYMLRLTRSVDVPADTEQSYRIILDELPIQLDQDAATERSTVSFQMRYSIPLFSYGKGLGSGLTAESVKANEKNKRAQPILNFWTEKNAEGQTELYIQNTGLKYARITGIRFTEKNTETNKDNVSLGYILANSTMKFALPAVLSQQVSQAKLLYSTDSSGAGSKTIMLKHVGP